MSKKKVDTDMDCEVVQLQPFSDEQKNTHCQGGTRGNDSDEENEDGPGAGGQRVQCAQQ